MSALANTIRQLSGRLALLRAERERYQALCAAAYQLAGTVNAPVRFLDAFSDGANGEIEARQRTDDLLPIDPQETGAFPAWSDAEVEGWKRDAERYRGLFDALHHGDIPMKESSISLNVCGVPPNRAEFNEAVDFAITPSLEIK